MGKSGDHKATVQLLDDTEFYHDILRGTKGEDLLSKVCGHLGLAENDYFGLRFIDEKDGQYNWIDPARPIIKQMKNAPLHFYFAVKFYPPNPTTLQEDLTRYQFVLQLREDLLKGRLQCSMPIQALLGSFIVQAEIGDYDTLEHGPNYLQDFKFCPKQPEEMLQKVHEFHKKHHGMLPSDAELQYLDNARKLPLYGVDLHQASDAEGQPVILGVSAWGIYVFHNSRLINKFVWPKILTIAFKKKKFSVTIRPANEDEQYRSTVISFKLGSLRATKRVWKVCVEHHSFFRLASADLPPKEVGVIKLGSKFRYSGRTQHQARHNDSIYSRPPPSFDRITSKRFSLRVLDSNRKSQLLNEDVKEKQDEEKPVEVAAGADDNALIEPTILLEPTLPEESAR